MGHLIVSDTTSPQPCLGSRVPCKSRVPRAACPATQSVFEVGEPYGVLLKLKRKSIAARLGALSITT